MPYKVIGKTVYKKDGKKVGTTKGNVANYLAALYANEKDREDNDKDDKKKKKKK